MLYILDTGHDVLRTSVLNVDEVQMKGEDGDLEGFDAHCTIVPDAFMAADSRGTTSCRNNAFVAKVDEALGEGKDIILITPSTSLLDKRLRESAIVIALPREKNVDDPLVL